MTHSWEYCSHCEEQVVICGTCGNNTCNGGQGVVGGKLCPDCKTAHALYLGKADKK